MGEDIHFFAKVVSKRTVRNMSAAEKEVNKRDARKLVTNIVLYTTH